MKIKKYTKMGYEYLSCKTDYVDKTETSGWPVFPGYKFIYSVAKGKKEERVFIKKEAS